MATKAGKKSFEHALIDMSCLCAHCNTNELWEKSWLWRELHVKCKREGYISMAAWCVQSPTATRGSKIPKASGTCGDLGRHGSLIMFLSQVIIYLLLSHPFDIHPLVALSLYHAIIYIHIQCPLITIPIIPHSLMLCYVMLRRASKYGNRTKKQHVTKTWSFEPFRRDVDWVKINSLAYDKGSQLIPV